MVSTGTAIFGPSRFERGRMGCPQARCLRSNRRDADTMCYLGRFLGSSLIVGE